MVHVNHFPWAVVSDSLLYADDTYTIFQHKNEIEIEKQLIRDFSSMRDWFDDIKLKLVSVIFWKLKIHQV